MPLSSPTQSLRQKDHEFKVPGQHGKTLSQKKQINKIKILDFKENRFFGIIKER
jgi:hypothetical protein